MADTVLLHQGYCVKSPPQANRRWRRRYCTLSFVTIPNLVDFHKKYNKGCNYDSNSCLPSTKQHLVFSYYENEDDAERDKDKAIKKFIIDKSTAIADAPTGVKNYPHVIKIQFGPVYDNRELLMCFSDEEKEAHQQWLKVLQANANHEESDFVELNLDTPVKKYEPVKDSHLHEELKRMRTIINKEREEKARLSSAASLDEEWVEYQPEKKDDSTQ